MGKNLLFLSISIHYFFFLRVCQPVALAVCLAVGHTMWVWILQVSGTEKQRMAETHQAGLVGLILASFDWYVRIEIVGNKKSTNTFDVQVAASLGAFTQRLPGQRPVLSCLHIGHQGMKSVHGNEVRPLSKRINQSKAVLRRSAAEWILSPLNLLSSVSKFIFQDFLSLHPRHMWELRYSSVSTMETLSGALRTEDNQDHSTCSPTTAIMC